MESRVSDRTDGFFLDLSEFNITRFSVTTAAPDGIANGPRRGTAMAMMVFFTPAAFRICVIHPLNPERSRE
jgi:hypothetical protein